MMNDEEIMKRFNESLTTDNNQTPVTPYHATGNLNMTIGNPNINVNDPMNVNIQNNGMNVNSNNVSSNLSSVDLLKPENSIVNDNITNNSSGNLNTNTSVNSNVNVAPNVNQAPVSNVNVQPNKQDISPNTSYVGDVTEQYIPNQELQDDQVYKTTTYISTQPSTSNNKKKTVKLTLTPETKIALVIALILFIFIMIMPTIYDVIRNIRF